MTKKIIDELNTVGGAPELRFMTPEEQQQSIADLTRALEIFEEMEPIRERARQRLLLKQQGKDYKL